MGRYDHLIHVFEKEYNTMWGDFMPEYQAYFRGLGCMAGSSLYASYRCYMKEAFVDRVSNFHSEEEYLCWMGYDVNDPFGSFDAEISFWIGSDLDHMEEHIITEPTIVRIPAYWWHCPLEYRRVGKPVYFEVVHIRGEFGTYQYREVDGVKKLTYTGFTTFNGRVPCVKNASKKCDWCGACGKKKPEGILEPGMPGFSPMQAKNAKCVLDANKICDWCGKCGRKKPNFLDVSEPKK